MGSGRRGCSAPARWTRRRRWRWRTRALPVADLALPGRRFYRFADMLDETVGFGGIEGEGADRLIRSVVVRRDRRGERCGKAVAQMLERLAGADGAQRLHLLTTDAASFFVHLGYDQQDRAEAPAAICWASEQFRTLFRQRSLSEQDRPRRLVALGGVDAPARWQQVELFQDEKRADQQEDDIV